jgi:hypothetical protein
MEEDIGKEIAEEFQITLKCLCVQCGELCIGKVIGMAAFHNICLKCGRTVVIYFEPIEEEDNDE